MDMWPAYIAAVEQALPEAAIVFDKFHTKKHLNEAVDKIRRRKPHAQGQQIPVAAAASGSLPGGRRAVPQPASPGPADRHRMGVEGKLRPVLRRLGPSSSCGTGWKPREPQNLVRWPKPEVSRPCVASL